MGAITSPSWPGERELSRTEAGPETSPAIHIRRATLDDAAALAELAARTFRDAFGADNTPEDLERHLKRSYGLSQQSAELANPGMTTLLADHADIPIGYVQLKSGPPPGSVIGNSPFEIMRFYVDQAWHGRGVAHHLMMETIAEARRQGAGTLWLGVWERNPRAIAFYRKWEFTPTGSTIFCVGNDRQNDLVMVRAL